VTFPRATAATDLRAALVLLGSVRRYLEHLPETERLLDRASRRIWRVVLALEPDRRRALERTK
jgi:hypothetical protein